jgi:replicative DNA helicase
VVVDYIQLIRSTGGQNRHLEIEKISAGLLALCKDIDAAVIILSQLNRKCEDRTNKRPLPSDLKESGSLEENAHIVMLLYRDEVYNTSPDNPEKGVAEIIIAKGRDIGQRTIRTAFIGEITGFRNLTDNGYRNNNQE